jgi:hypothetical protein
MALARTARLAQTSGLNHGAGAFTSSAFTPSNNSLLIVVASFVANGDTGTEGNILTISDSATLTWTPIAVTTASPNWTYGIRAWSAPVTTGASMTLTLDAGTEDVYLYRAVALDYTGYDTGSPIGGTIVGSDADGDGAASITLSSTPASASEVIAFVMKVVSAGVGAVTPGSDFTELSGSDTGVSGWAAFQGQTRTGSTSTTVGWDDLDVGGSPLGATMLAFEVKAAAGAAVTPSVGALIFTGLAATVALSGSMTRTPSVGALTLTGNQASVTTSGSHARTPSVGSLAFTGLQPIQSLTVAAPITGVLTLTGNSPTVAVTLNHVRQPSVGLLAFTGNAPSVLTPRTITPSFGSLTLTGLSATVVTGAANTTVTPSVGALTINGQLAVLSQSSPLIRPSTGSMSFTGNVPGSVSSSDTTLHKSIVRQGGMMVL